jgi:hypothetical protein
MNILFLLLFSPKNCPFSREFEGTRPGVLDIRHLVNFYNLYRIQLQERGL